jgi:hypothetical protein
MKMNRNYSFAIAVLTFCFLAGVIEVSAQSPELPKFEVGADFSTITFNPGQTELGLGARLTYNLNKHVALEGAGYLFPRNCTFCSGGRSRVTEGLFGVKAGKRFEKWGIFGKVRPGVMSFAKGKFDIIQIANPAPGPGVNLFDFRFSRLTTPVVDVGGVVEFYPSKRIVTRVDFGDTIIHYASRTTDIPVFNSTTSTYSLIPSTTPSQTRGSLQFSVGVGFRF